MAISWNIIYGIVDEKGAISSTEIHVPGATTFTNALAFAVEMGGLIDTLISGQLYRFGIVADEIFTSGVKTAPEDGSDVEEGGRFQFVTDEGHFTSLRLPTFREEYIVPETRNIDTADADVLAFVTAMIDGIDLAGALPVVAPSDARDEDIDGLSSAKESFTASRRG